MKEYYYLDGLDKKGPYSEDELLNLGLSRDVLIWKEGFENWKSFNDVIEIINSVPIPILQEILTENQIAKKSRKLVYSCLLFFSLLIVATLIAFILTESIKLKSKKEISQKIEGIFGGKSIVCDGVHYAVKGKLSTIEELTISNFKDKNDNLHYKDKNDRIRELVERRAALDELGKLRQEGLVEKFICVSGGFTFNKLKKVDNGFELEVWTSTDMGYKSSSYNRGTIQEAYNSAFDYIKKENSGCYANSYYDLIENFKFLENKFYFVANVQKPSYPNLSYWCSEKDGNIFNNYSMVYYRTQGWYYEINPKEDEIRNSFLKIALIGFLISILITVVFFVSNPFKW
jgi:heme/copper-type cytochrome/quinol oxidase subunit 4